MATSQATLAILRPPHCAWTVECCGSFALRHPDGREVAPRGRKAQAIIAYLVIHLDERVSRDRLIELLWPERAESQARGSLRQSLHEIRRAVPNLIQADQQHVWVDRKDVHVHSSEHLSGDEVLFGDLDGITAEFDDWLRRERFQEGSKEWSELCRKVEAKLKHGDGPGALPLIERMKLIDPYNEDWLRFAMRAEFLAGHPAGVQTRFQEMKQLLKRELDVNVSSQTCALHDELLLKLSPGAETHGGGAHPTADQQFETNVRKAREAFGVM